MVKVNVSGLKVGLNAKCCEFLLTSLSKLNCVYDLCIPLGTIFLSPLFFHTLVVGTSSKNILDLCERLRREVKSVKTYCVFHDCGEWSISAFGPSKLSKLKSMGQLVFTQDPYHYEQRRWKNCCL